MTESLSVDALPLAFEGFLAHLRRLGFVIGVDQHLRMEQLIERIGGHCAPGDLKTLLCPIFAVSEKQQELFYDAFDSSFPLFVVSHPEEPGSDTDVRGSLDYRAVTVRERFYHGPLARKWFYFAAANVLAAGLIAFAVWRPRTSAPPPLVTTPPTAEAPVQAPAALPPQRPEQPAPPKLEPLLTADQRRDYNRAIDERLYRVRKALVVLAKKSLTPDQSDVVTRITTFQRQAEEAREQDLLTAVNLAARADLLAKDLWETEWPAVPPRKRPAVPPRERPPVPPREPSLLERTSPWLAVLIPVLWFVCYELYRFRRRKLVLQKQQGKMPPHSWPIRMKASASKIYESPAFYTAARRLHSRVRGDSPDLDIAGTVSATVRALGYPRFQYRRMTRLPDYLVLIDRASSHDHQARLFDRLASALHEEGLFLERYFYDGDPRECWREDSEHPVSLAELQRRYSGHRLLLLGDAGRMIDAVSGKLTRWSGLLEGWTDRAILTPVPPSQWGVAERALAGQFIVLPATQNGLLALVDYFGGSGPADARGWLEEFPSQRELDSAAMLREHLGPEAFQWLCACAVYPELHWDLTLHLGSLPSMPEGLINEADLLRLIRLPWFRAGSMPDELRWSLIQELSRQQEREVREAIIDLIEKSPAPEETFAADAQRMQILFQRYFLVCRDAARRGIRRILEHVPEGEIQREYVVLRSLESLRGSIADFLLPNRLRRLLFAQGTSVLGLRTGVRLLLTLFVLGAGFSAVSYWKVYRLESEINLLAKDSTMEDSARRARITQRLDLLARAPIDLRIGVDLRDPWPRFPEDYRAGDFNSAVPVLTFKESIKEYNNLHRSIGALSVVVSEKQVQLLLDEVGQQVKPLRVDGEYRTVLSGQSEMPGVFTKDGLAIFEDLVAKRSFVTGASPNQERAFAESETRQLLKALYYRKYATAWREFLGSYKVIRYSGPDDAARRLNILSGTTSPLLGIVKLVAVNTRFPAPKLGFGGLLQSGTKAEKEIEHARQLVSGNASSMTKADFARLFQPVLFTTPAEVDLLVNDHNGEYVKGLRGLQNSLEALGRASTMAEKTTLTPSAQAALTQARASHTALADKFENAGSEGLNKILSDLLEQPIRLAAAWIPQKLETGGAPLLNNPAGRPTSQGTLFITANVDGAQVYIRGQLSRDRVQQGLWKQSLPPGEYNVRLALDGYDAAAGEKVTIVAGKETTRRFELKPSPTIAFLRIEGGTPNADIWLDGQQIGKLNSAGSLGPAVITPGVEHSIRFTKENYEPSSELKKQAPVKQTILISGSEARLKPFGQLWITEVQPYDTQLTIQRRGDKPLKLDVRAFSLQEGTYVVRGTADRYEPFEQEVQVKSARGTSIPVVLRPKQALAVSMPPVTTVTKRAAQLTDLFDDPVSWRPNDDGRWTHDGQVARLKERYFTVAFDVAIRKRLIGFDKLHWRTYLHGGDYMEFELDDKMFSKRVNAGGKLTQWEKEPHGIGQGGPYRLEINVQPDRIIIKIGQVTDAESRKIEGATEFAGRFNLQLIALGIPTDSQASLLQKKNGELGQFCQAMSPILAKYPFTSAGQSEATLNDIATAFGPGGGLVSKYVQKSASDLVVRPKTEWERNPDLQGVKVTPELLSFLNRAQQFTDAFFAEGGSPKMKYVLGPVAGQTIVVRLTLDGTELSSESALRKTFFWPAAPGVKQGAVGTVEIGVSAGFGSFENDLWGVFRLFQNADERPFGTHVVKWSELRGRWGAARELNPAPKVEIVEFPGDVDVFNPKFFEALKCPQKAVIPN